jgi:hypothetical protein
MSAARRKRFRASEVPSFGLAVASVAVATARGAAAADVATKLDGSARKTPSVSCATLLRACLQT